MVKLSCDQCSECCFLLSIEEISKPFITWCPHARPKRLKDGVPLEQISGGCGIYETRPKPCREFACLWLMSQDRAGQEMPLSMRPNNSGVMFNVSPTDQKHIYAHVVPTKPDAYRKKAVWAKIQDLVKRGGTVEVVIGKTRKLIRPGQPIVTYTEEDVERHNERTKAEQLRQTMGFADSAS